MVLLTALSRGEGVLHVYVSAIEACIRRVCFGYWPIRMYAVIPSNLGVFFYAEARTMGGHQA